jgi:hypothetical protein
MKYFISFLTILSIALFINSCTCSTCGNEESVIPYSVLTKADLFIANQTGSKFFQNYIKPDFSKIKRIGTDIF